MMILKKKMRPAMRKMKSMRLKPAFLPERMSVRVPPVSMFLAGLSMLSRTLM